MRGDRVVDRLEAVLGDVGQLAQLGALDLGQLGDVDAPARDLRELGVALVGPVQMDQGVEGRGVVVILGEDLAPRGDRRVSIAELVLGDHRDPRQKLAALARRRRPLGAAAEHDDHVLPGLGLLVEQRQGLGRGHRRLRILRVDLEQLAVGDRRLLGIAEVAQVDLGHRRAELGAQGDVTRVGGVRGALEDDGDVGQLTGLAPEAQQVVAGPLV